jgi:hypothetical protein
MNIPTTDYPGVADAVRRQHPWNQGASPEHFPRTYLPVHFVRKPDFLNARNDRSGIPMMHRPWYGEN